MGSHKSRRPPSSDARTRCTARSRCSTCRCIPKRHSTPVRSANTSANRCRNTNCPSRSRSWTTSPRTPSARSTNRRCANASSKHVEKQGPSDRKGALIMGFTKPDLPDVDPDTFMQKPLMERMRILATDWVDNGFGSPKMVHTIYIAKLLFLYAFGGILVATLTSGLPFLHVSQWWNQPIVYEKAVLWTIVLELIGVAGSWGPLAGKIKPMTGGILFWARPGTIRLRPWKWVPLTGGDRRTWFDVGLYIVLMISVAVPLFSPGVQRDSLSVAMPGNSPAPTNPGLRFAPIALLVLMGLRDKIVF